MNKLNMFLWIVKKDDQPDPGSDPTPSDPDPEEEEE
jgi:hypothetical protein